MAKHIKEYLNSIIDNDYALSVLYYEMRVTLAANNLDFIEQPTVLLEWKYLGREETISISDDCYGQKKSLALLLSVRAIMLYKECMDICEDDRLVFTNDVFHSIDWFDFSTLLADCLKDQDFLEIFNLMRKIDDGERITINDICTFTSHNKIDRSGDLVDYYRTIASNGQSTDKVISDNAYVMNNDIVDYVVPDTVKYIGNTAFSFCANLQSITIQTENVKFGKFPIIECYNLKRIIVPKEAVEYYKFVLPNYSSIITCGGEESNDINPTPQDEDCEEEVQKEATSDQKRPGGAFDSDNKTEPSDLIEGQDKKTAKDSLISASDAPSDFLKGDVSNMKNQEREEQFSLQDNDGDFEVNVTYSAKVIDAHSMNDYIIQFDNGKRILLSNAYFKAGTDMTGKTIFLKKKKYNYAKNKTVWQLDKNSPYASNLRYKVSKIPKVIKDAKATKKPMFSRKAVYEMQRRAILTTKTVAKNVNYSGRIMNFKIVGTNIDGSYKLLCTNTDDTEIKAVLERRDAKDLHFNSETIRAKLISQDGSGVYRVMEI